MRITKLGIKEKKANVILGAGASRGAACFQSEDIKPPLDFDFFTQMELVSYRDPALKDFLKFVKSEFSVSPMPKMEELFTQLEALDAFHSNLKIAPGPIVKRYKYYLDRYVEMIARYFSLVFVDRAKKHRSCKSHESLAACLHTEDSIISFNYDCLIDEALRRKGGKKWQADKGYKVPISSGKEWSGDAGGPGAPPKASINLLKLHGSLNWNRSAGTGTQAAINLRKDPYEHTPRHKSEVIPPVWNKSVTSDSAFQEIWKEARKELRTGPVMIAIGYSVPLTDLLSQSLIRVSGSERSSSQKLSHLIVVNPSQNDRRRFIDILQGGINSDTVIVELNDLNALNYLLT